jgi:predicted site-specific integrase-resolvase
MDRYLKIGAASKKLGVSIGTLRRWEREGKISVERVPSGHRVFDMHKLAPERFPELRKVRKTVAYARVSSHDQKADLERQKAVLESFCAAKGWSFSMICDLGSGMNYRKKGLKALLDDIIDGNVERLVVTHKDRLLRFGAELVFAICDAKNVEVVVINESEESSFEEDLAKDVLEIITVFSARLYGSRSRKNAKLLSAVKEIAEEPAE